MRNEKKMKSNMFVLPHRRIDTRHTNTHKYAYERVRNIPSSPLLVPQMHCNDNMHITYIAYFQFEFKSFEKIKSKNLHKKWILFAFVFNLLKYKRLW